MRYWELDDLGQPTQRIIESRRRAEFITPITNPGSARKRQVKRNWFSTRAKGLLPRSNRTRRLLPKSTECCLTGQSFLILGRWRFDPVQRRQNGAVCRGAAVYGACSGPEAADETSP